MDEKKKLSGEEFIEAVCAKVRFAPAREQIAEELRAHLEDRAAMLEEHGVPPEDAAARAAAPMGDPAEIGAALDREHSPLWGWAAVWTDVARYLALAALALGVGLVLMSAEPEPALFRTGEIVYDEFRWTEAGPEEYRQETIPLQIPFETEDSCGTVQSAELRRGARWMEVTVRYEERAKDFFQPVVHDVWCRQIRGADGAVLAARDSRWAELENQPVEGPPPETLYLDLVTARGTEFTVEVPLEAGGEGQ